MSRLADWLCSFCTEVLNATSTLARNGDSSITPKGQSLEASKDAVDKRCRMCVEIWRYDDRTDPWQPLRFDLSIGDSSKVPAGPQTPWFMINIWQGDCFKVVLALIQADDPQYQKYFPALHVEGNTGSIKTLDMARSWFEDCSISHEKCQGLSMSKPGWVPSRLIDIGANEDSLWKLRITSEDVAGPAPTYMTLSYRWGSKSQTWALNRGNIEEFRLGQHTALLPKTFRDFFSVARHFGVRYVWIDSLCIMQSSSEDWDAESPTMRYIYANSACNICASISDDPSGGLFSDRKPFDIQTGIVEVAHHSNTRQRYFLSNLWYVRDHYSIETSALGSRGWILQERFLAPRLLWSTSKQVLWECHERHICEGFPNGFPEAEEFISGRRRLLPPPKNDKAKAVMSDETIQIWHHWLTEYCLCKLTKPTDKLYAFAGVAKYFQEATGDEYMAGVWRSRIVEELGWTTWYPRTRPLQYRAPSWSWASVNDEFRPALPSKLSGSERKYLVEAVDVGVTPKSEDATVDVVDGFLKLKGMILVVQFQPLAEERYGEVKCGVSDAPMRVRFFPDFSGLGKDKREILLLMYCITDDPTQSSKHAEYNHYLTCLIMEIVDEPNMVYRRIGILRVGEREPVKRIMEASPRDLVEITVI